MPISFRTINRECDLVFITWTPGAGAGKRFHINHNQLLCFGTVRLHAVSADPSAASRSQFPCLARFVFWRGTSMVDVRNDRGTWVYYGSKGGLQNGLWVRGLAGPGEVILYLYVDECSVL